MPEQQPDREGGAWIGQRPDPDTKEVRESLGDGAERVAVTNNESDDSTQGEGQRSDKAQHNNGNRRAD
ncbi:MAG TPA: hypothetical protein VFH90_01100 [Candidatus Limnocylindria bacterium]|nr:hypothetical protein [Candidatus Limnocylindria bacterium]